MKKRATIVHKGGIGNILQAIPLIKACLEQYDLVYFDLLADYPVTEELFVNWSERIKNRIKLSHGGGDVFNLTMSIIKSPVLKSKIYKRDSLKVGEAQVYLKVLTNKTRADLNCIAPLHTLTSIVLPENYVVIWPGCKKNWPIKAYPYHPKLIDLFLTKYNVVLVGQQRELFIDSIPSKAINLLDKLSLGEVADVIRKSIAFVGNDGGITHLAATTGVQTYAIFGPTSVIKNKPCSENVEVISANFECMPCQETPGFSCEICKKALEPNCLEVLKPLMIFNKIQSDIEEFLM